MSNYYKLVTYTDGAEYETHEKLIDLDTFRKYQRAIAEGMKILILEDRVIKISSIKEIIPADDIVREYITTGGKLNELGLKESDRLGQGETFRLDEGFKKAF